MCSWLSVFETLEPIFTQSTVLVGGYPPKSFGFQVMVTLIVWPGATKLPFAPADVTFTNDPD